MATVEELKSFPYLVWVDYGTEGWRPFPYKSLDAAVQHDGHGSAKIVTKPAQFVVIDVGDKKEQPK